MIEDQTANILTSWPGEKAVNFTVQDVLCFAWQIAGGMVGD